MTTDLAKATEPLALKSNAGLGLANPKRYTAVLIEYLRHLSQPGSPGDQAADVLAEQTREIELLRGAIAADDERLQKAAERSGLANFGCDTVADVMRLGDTEQFEVWFLPTNREGYAPRMLADGMEGVAVAREFIAATGGRYHGTLEVVRTVTRRQRIAA